MHTALNALSIDDYDNFIKANMNKRASKNIELEIDEVKIVKDLYNLYFDSGANGTHINNKNLSDTIIDINRHNANDSVTVAGGQRIQILGRGSLLNHKTHFAPNFHTSLLSVHKTLASNDALGIFTDKDVHVIKNTEFIKNLIHYILNLSKSNKTMILNGKVVKGMYVIKGDSILAKNKSDTNDVNINITNDELLSNYVLDNSFAIDSINNEYNIDNMDEYNLLLQTNFKDSINSTINVKDDETLLSSFNLNMANASYFTNVPTAKVSSAAELVRYFHEALNHASEEIMIRIVEHELIEGLPQVLTPQLIRKHFPRCDACPIGNLARRPIISNPIVRDIKIGEEWQVDMKGPWTDDKGKICPTFSGNRLSILCHDMKSKMRVGFLSQNKGYLLRYIKHLRLITIQRRRVMKTLRIDEDFLTEEITDWCRSNKIDILPCIPHEHATLPDVERDNRTIQEAVVKVLYAKPHLSFKYCGMALMDIITKWNIFPSIGTPNVSPYELWFGYKYNLNHNPIVPFGSVVYAHIPLDDQTAMSGRSIRTFHVGFAQGHKGGILLFNPVTKRTIVRRSFKIMGPIDQPESNIILECLDHKGDSEIILDPIDTVILNKEIIDDISKVSKTSPLSKNKPTRKVKFIPSEVEDNVIPELISDIDSDDEDMPELPVENCDDEDDSILHNNIFSNKKDIHFGNDTVLDHDPLVAPYVRNIPIIDESKRLDNDEFYVDRIINHKGRGNKMEFWVKWVGQDDDYNSWIKWTEAKDLAAMDSYLTNNPEVQVPVTATKHINPIKRSKKKSNLKKQDKVLPQIFNYLPPKASRGALQEDAHKEFEECEQQAYATHTTSSKTIPRNYHSINHYKDADEWYKATKSEVGSMFDNAVWEDPDVDINSIPKNLILPSMLIYDKQFNPDGSFKKYKCRLVCRGDKWYDIYNMNTYASTVKSESVRMMLAIAAIEDWEMESVDVKTAFLNAPLNPGEIIYMRRPAGLTDEHMPSLVRLKKCIYGMPQASAYFHEHSDKVLRSFNCNPIPEDDCVYKLVINGETAFVLKHVDDFGIMSKHQHLIDFIKFKLSQSYQISINLDMSFYLGLCIIRDRIARSIVLNQSGYILNLIEMFGLDKIDKYPSTPMCYYANDNNPIIEEALDTAGVQDYQSRVGCLLWLAIMTRFDILYATSMASRKSKSPTTRDLAAVNRILLYIAGTAELGLKFHSDEGVTLYATVDASYACHKDSKSHTGCSMHIGRSSGATQAISKKQTITADSSTVAEFVATHTAAKEIMWARGFLFNIGFPQENPTILYEDNMSTIAMIKNKSNGKRTKHVEVRYNLISDQVSNKVIAMEWLNTNDMTSYMLTKALAPGPFVHLRKNLLGMHVEHDVLNDLIDFVDVHNMLRSIGA